MKPHYFTQYKISSLSFIFILICFFLALPSSESLPQLLGSTYSIIYPSGNLPTYPSSQAGPKLFFSTEFSEPLYFRPRFCNVPTSTSQSWVSYDIATTPYLYPAWSLSTFNISISLSSSPSSSKQDGQSNENQENENQSNENQQNENQENENHQQHNSNTNHPELKSGLPRDDHTSFTSSCCPDCQPLSSDYSSSVFLSPNASSSLPPFDPSLICLCPASLSSASPFLCLAPNAHVPFLRLPPASSTLLQVPLSPPYRAALAAARQIPDFSSGTFAFSVSSVSLAAPIHSVAWQFDDADDASPADPQAVAADPMLTRYDSGRGVAGYFCDVPLGSPRVWLRIDNPAAQSPAGASVNVSTFLDSPALPASLFHGLLSASPVCAPSPASASSVLFSSAPSPAEPCLFSNLKEAGCSSTVDTYPLQDPNFNYLLSFVPLSASGVYPDEPELRWLRTADERAVQYVTELTLLAEESVFLPWDLSTFTGGLPFSSLKQHIEQDCHLQFYDVFVDPSDQYLINPRSGFQQLRTPCTSAEITYYASFYQQSLDNVFADPLHYESHVRTTIAIVGSRAWDACTLFAQSFMRPASLSLPRPSFPLRACALDPADPRFAADPCCNHVADLLSPECCAAHPQQTRQSFVPLGAEIHKDCPSSSCATALLEAQLDYLAQFDVRDPCIATAPPDRDTMRRQCQAQVGITPCVDSFSGAYLCQASSNFICVASAINAADGICLPADEALAQDLAEQYFSCMIASYRPLLNDPFWSDILLQFLGTAVVTPNMDFDQVRRALHDYVFDHACVGPASVVNGTRLDSLTECSAHAGCAWGSECDDALNAQLYGENVMSCADACFAVDETQRQGQPSGESFCGLCAPIFSSPLMSSTAGEFFYPSVCFDVSLEPGCYAGANLVSPSTYYDAWWITCQAFNAPINPIARRCFLSSITDATTCASYGAVWSDGQFNTPERCAQGFCAQRPEAGSENCTDTFVCTNPLPLQAYFGVPSYDPDLSQTDCESKYICSSFTSSASQSTCLSPVTADLALLQQLMPVSSDWGIFAFNLQLRLWEPYHNESYCQSQGGFKVDFPIDFNQPCPELRGCVKSLYGSFMGNLLQNDTQCHLCGSEMASLYHTMYSTASFSSFYPLVWTPRDFSTPNRWTRSLNFTAMDLSFQLMYNLQVAADWINYQRCRNSQFITIIPQFACQCDAEASSVYACNARHLTPSFEFGDTIFCPPTTSTFSLLSGLLLVGFSSPQSDCVHMKIDRYSLAAFYSEPAIKYPSLYNAPRLDSKYQVVRNDRDIVAGWAISDGFGFTWSPVPGGSLDGNQATNATFCMLLDPWIAPPKRYNTLDFATYVRGGVPLAYSPALRPLYRSDIWLAVPASSLSIDPSTQLGAMTTQLGAYSTKVSREKLVSAFQEHASVYLCTRLSPSDPVMFAVLRLPHPNDYTYFQALSSAEQAALVVALILIWIALLATLARLLGIFYQRGLMTINAPRIILAIQTFSLLLDLIFYMLIATDHIQRLTLEDMFFATFPGFLFYSIFILLLGCWIEQLYVKFPVPSLMTIKHRLFWSDVFFYSLFLIYLIVYASIPMHLPDWTTSYCGDFSSYNSRELTSIVFNSLIVSFALLVGLALFGLLLSFYYNGQLEIFPSSSTPALPLSAIYLLSFLGQSIFLLYYSSEREDVDFIASVVFLTALAVIPTFLLLLLLRDGTNLAKPTLEKELDDISLLSNVDQTQHEFDD